MELKQYLKEESVFVAEGTTKQQVLEESADVCAAATHIDRKTLLEAINHRESLMSTGIGQGLAVPHVRLAEAKRPALAVAICPDGIADYAAIDNKPITIVVLIVAPRGRHETYIRLLAEVVEVLKQPELREKIITADTPTRAYQNLIGEN
ncbi:MAG: PTS sugar transporter subunit IIA [Phycisphaerae bacterium]|nr:PTS sugar transporter subunit IIA [Phycisphaerae bacterium]